MAAYFGLHVGATSISIAVCRDKNTEVLANDAGDRVIPAFIAYNEGEMAVGVYSSRNANNLISCCKRLLGYSSVNCDEVQSVQKRCPCKIVKVGNKDELGYELTNSDGKIIEIIAAKKALGLIFKQLMDTAMRHIGIRGDSYAVLAVPVEFTEEQKQLMKDAASSNGFKVLQLISEPSAAVLACQLDHEINEPTLRKRTAVVYRAGGTSVTVTVFSIYSGYYRILASVNRPHLGGEDVTDLIVEHLCEEFQRVHRMDIRSKPRSIYKLRHAAEECKRVLSSVTTTQCSVESLHDGVDFLCNVSRARLESLFTAIMSRFLEPLEEALSTCNLATDDIDMLVLCGGTCKIPRLQQVLANYFPKVDIMHRHSPDEILAIGAAYQAEQFKGMEDINNLDEEFVIPTVPNSLYYKLTEGGESKLIFEKGTPVPVERNELIKPSEGQCDIHILEMDINGSDPMERPVAKISMEDLDDNSVSVTFNMKLNNTLEVLMTSKELSRSFTIF